MVEPVHAGLPLGEAVDPARRRALSLLALALLGVGLAAWSAVPAGVWHDDGVYMITAKALATGHGLTYEGVVGAPPAVKFPPLYPGVLALLWLVLGGIGPVTMAATLANLGLIVLAGVLFAKALHESAGLPLRASVVVAGLAFVSTELLRVVVVPLSEPLFVCLTMAAFSLWKPAVEEGGTRARVGLALVLAAAVATRSAGLALVVAFAPPLAARLGPKRTLGLVGPAFGLAAAWAWWAAARSADIPEGMRDVLGPYGGWLGDQMLAAPTAFAAALPAHVAGVLGALGGVAFPGLPPWLVSIGGVPALALTGVGLLVLLRRFPPATWYVGAYLVMLAVWPYLDRRLIVPVYPIVLGAAAIGVVEALARARSRWSRAILIGAVASWTTAYTVVTAGRIAAGWPAAPHRVRAAQLATAMEALGRTVPRDAVLGAPELWPALYLHGGWTVAPSARFLLRPADPATPSWGSPRQQIELWRAAGIDHLLLEQGGAILANGLNLIEEKCPGTVFVLARMPRMFVVKIAWDPACDPVAGEV